MRSRTSLLVALVALGATTFAQSPPQSLPVLQSADMKYLGKATLPAFCDGAESGTDATKLRWSTGTLGPGAKGGLLIGAYVSGLMAEVSLPQPGETSTVVTPCVRVPAEALAKLGEYGMLGGVMFYNERLMITGYNYYDANGVVTLSHAVIDPTSGAILSDFQRVGKFESIDESMKAGFVAGYMGLIPPEWRSLFGGPALTGACCMPIISRTSSGPSVSVFDPDAVGKPVNSKAAVPATMVLGYPLSHPLADAENASKAPGTDWRGKPSVPNPHYTRADFVGGVAFVPGSRSVLFVGRHGLGAPCYGDAEQCGNDTKAIYKGEHAAPYQMQVWAYDANDLLAVKTGKKKPWDPRPYAVWALPDMTPSLNTQPARNGAFFLPSTGRWYVMAGVEDVVEVHIYQVAAPSAPTSPSPGDDRGQG